MIRKLRCSYTESMNYTLPFFSYKTQDLISIFKVLDLDYMLPNIEKIDLHDFYANHWTNNMSDWVMNYTHFNTIFVKNMTDLESTKYQYKRRRRWIATNKTYRDILTIGREFSDFDTWTVYDAMMIGVDFCLHQSLFEYHKSFYRYNIRLAEPIRIAARETHKKFGCIPYISVHIRATEKFFEDRLTNGVSQTMEKVISETTEWLNRVEEAPEKICLFLLTDWPALFEYPPFKEKLLKLESHVLKYNKTKLLVLNEYGNRISGYSRIVKLLGNAIGVEDGEASMLLAQQVAACGTIGFSGTSGSTYSFLIENIRTSPCAC